MRIPKTCLALLLTLSTGQLAADQPQVSLQEGPHYVGGSIHLSIAIPGTREAHQVDLSPLDHLEARILEAAPLPATAEPAFLIRVRILATQAGNFEIPPLTVFGPEGRWQTPAKEYRVELPEPSEEISVRMTSDREEVYVGEPFIVTVEWEFDDAITAFHAVDLRLPWMGRNDLQVQDPRTLPPLPGNEIGLPVAGTRVIARVEGRTIRFRKIVTTREPGELLLTPATLLASRSTEQPGRGRGVRRGGFQYPAYFDNQFFDAPEEGNFERIFNRSLPLRVRILPLPEEEKPPSFTGIVGAFEVASSVQPEQGFVGSPLRFEIRLLQHRLPETLDLPALKTFPGFSGRFDLPPDRGLPGLESTDRGWVRTFRQSIRPLSTGVEFVPGIRLSYFDPVTGTYETVETPRLPLQINPARMASIFEATLDDGERLRNRLEPKNKGIAALYSVQALNQKSSKLPLSNPRYWLLAIGLPLFFTLSILSATHRRRSFLRDPDKTRAYYALSDFRKALKRAPNETRRLHALRGFFADRLNRSPAALTPGEITRDLQYRNLRVEGFKESLAALRRGDYDAFAAGQAEPEETDWPTILKELRHHGAPPVPAEIRTWKERWTRPALLPVWLGVLLLLLLLNFPAFVGPQDFGNGIPEEAMKEAEGFFHSGLDRHLDEPEEAREDFERAAALYELALGYQENPRLRGRLHYNAGSARFYSQQSGLALAHFLRARALTPEDTHTRRAIDHLREIRIDEVPLRWIEQFLGTPFSLTKSLSQNSQRSLLTLAICLLCLTWLIHAFFPIRQLRITALWVGILSVLFSAILVWEYFQIRVPHRGVITAPETIARQGDGLIYARAFETPLHEGFEFKLLERRGDWVAIDPGGDLPVAWVQAQDTQPVWPGSCMKAASGP